MGHESFQSLHEAETSRKKREKYYDRKWEERYRSEVSPPDVGEHDYVDSYTTGMMTEQRYHEKKLGLPDYISPSQQILQRAAQSSYGPIQRKESPDEFRRRLANADNLGIPAESKAILREMQTEASQPLTLDEGSNADLSVMDRIRSAFSFGARAPNMNQPVDGNSPAMPSETRDAYMKREFPKGYKIVNNGLMKDTDVRGFISNLAREYSRTPDEIETQLLVANSATTVSDLQKSINAGRGINVLDGFGWTPAFQQKYYAGNIFNRAMNATLDGQNLIEWVKIDLWDELERVPSGTEINARFREIARNNKYKNESEFAEALWRGDYGGGVDLVQALLRDYTEQIRQGDDIATARPYTGILGTKPITEMRHLTHNERMLLKVIYGQHFRTEDITVQSGSNPITFGNDITLPRQYFKKNGTLRDYALRTFVHEAGHTAQYQFEDGSYSYAVEATLNYYLGLAHLFSFVPSVGDYLFNWVYGEAEQARELNYLPGAVDEAGNSLYNSMLPDGQAELPAAMYWQAIFRGSNYRNYYKYRTDWTKRSYADLR